MIRAIAAIDEKRGIAKNGGIPWKLPEDVAYFRQQTEGGIIVMGEATYQEFDNPLAGRRNLVASRTLHEVREGFEVVDDVAAFASNCSEDIWIIGGAGLFASTLQLCDELYLTHIAHDFGCDRFFPEFADSFRLLQKTREHTDETSSLSYHFAVYKRIENR
jgi:dihydrofolate reductase